MTQDSFGNPVNKGDIVFYYDVDNKPRHGKLRYNGNYYVRYPNGEKITYEPHLFFRDDAITNNVKKKKLRVNWIALAFVVIVVAICIYLCI